MQSTEEESRTMLAAAFAMKVNDLMETLGHTKRVILVAAVADDGRKQVGISISPFVGKRAEKGLEFPRIRLPYLDRRFPHVDSILLDIIVDIAHELFGDDPAQLQIMDEGAFITYRAFGSTHNAEGGVRREDAEAPEAPNAGEDSPAKCENLGDPAVAQPQHE